MANRESAGIPKTPFKLINNLGYYAPLSINTLLE